MSFDPEELFPPKPGGMVDSTRQQKQAEADQRAAHSAKVPSQGDEGEYTPIRVDILEPTNFGARTVVVPGTNSNYMRVLGYDKNRKHATIMAIDYPVVVAPSEAAAADNRNAGNAVGESAGGFFLPVNVPFPIHGYGEVWVAAATDTAGRVSVWSEAKEA